MDFAKQCNTIFNQATEAYHVTDCIDAPVANPYPEGSIEHTLFAKTCATPYSGTWRT